MKKYILLICVLLLSIVLCACGSENPSSALDTEKSQEQKNEYRLGEEIIINKGSGDYKFAITKVEETSERNEFSDKNPTRVVIISYVYENASCENELYISDMNFKAYDYDNNSMDTYPLSSLEYPDSISTGRKSSGEMAFGLNSEENHIELEYYDNMFLGSDCKIILNW